MQDRTEAMPLGRRFPLLVSPPRFDHPTCKKTKKPRKRNVKTDPKMRVSTVIYLLRFAVLQWGGA